MGACRGRKAGVNRGMREMGVTVVSCVWGYRTLADVELATNMRIHAVEGCVHVSATHSGYMLVLRCQCELNYVAPAAPGAWTMLHAGSLCRDAHSAHLVGP